MSISRRIADEQPDHFAFSAENKKKIKAIMAKYPKERKASAVLPLLDLAQRQHDNWIPMKAIEAIAIECDMAGNPGAGSRNVLHHVQSQACG
jgi:NADH:ubiquinone oxidoreductase subunit E